MRVLFKAQATARTGRAGHPPQTCRILYRDDLRCLGPGWPTLPVAATSFLLMLEWIRWRENLIVCGSSAPARTRSWKHSGNQRHRSGYVLPWRSKEDLGALVCRYSINDGVNKAIIGPDIMPRPSVLSVNARRWRLVFWKTLTAAYGMVSRGGADHGSNCAPVKEAKCDVGNEKENWPSFAARRAHPPRQRGGRHRRSSRTIPAPGEQRHRQLDTPATC